MSDGEIKVTFSSLEQAGTDTATAFAAIQREVADLKTYLKPLVSTWTGQAALNYQAQQTKWDTAMTDLADILRIVSGSLGTAHENFLGAENANARIWD